MDKLFSAAKRTIGETVAVFREAAHDAVYDLRDNASRGFGVPNLVSTVASLSVAGVAAAGTVSITLDMVSKVLLTRECKTCNGWEGLRCTMCLGEGSVQYSISGQAKAKSQSVESLARGVVDGSEEITYYPQGFNLGYFLPRKKCPTCNGMGVIKCTECKGFAWKLKFSMDDIMDVPSKNWDMFQKTRLPREVIYENVKDPAAAAFLLYERDELEGGFKYDEEEKQKIMTEYYKSRRYNHVRQLVAERQPGWEQLQDALYTINPDRAKQDAVIIKDVPHFKARKKIEAEVSLMEVPPRPAEWTEKNNLPLRKSYWSYEEQKDPVKSKEMQVLLEAQEKLIGQALDLAWADEWRQNKIQEILQEKVHSYIKAGETGKTKVEKQETEQAKPKMSVPVEKSVSGVPAKGRDSKAAPQKTEKSQKADQKKKKEKQERTERLAKQAAEREAALAKAKKGPK